MRDLFNVAGITFRHKEDAEVANLRPYGVVEVVPEPTNKFDANALAIMCEGHHIGYVPSYKSKYPQIQKTILGLIKSGEAYSVEVTGYSYKDDNGFNDNHSGKLMSVKLALCTDGDFLYRVKDGKTYSRVSQFVGTFKPDGRDALDAWMINRHATYKLYLAHMKELADRGTQMHTALEEYFKDRTHILPALPKNLNLFLDRYDIEPVSFEERMYDDETGLTGQYDMLAWVTDKKTGGRFLTVIDWKSSKAVRESHKLQNCWYSLNKGLEMGQQIEAMVVAFGSDNPSVYLMDCEQVEDGYKAVLSLTEAAKLMKTL